MRQIYCLSSWLIISQPSMRAHWYQPFFQTFYRVLRSIQISRFLSTSKIYSFTFEAIQQRIAMKCTLFLLVCTIEMELWISQFIISDNPHHLVYLWILTISFRCLRGPWSWKPWIEEFSVLFDWTLPKTPPIDRTKFSHRP